MCTMMIKQYYILTVFSVIAMLTMSGCFSATTKDKTATHIEFETTEVDMVSGLIVSGFEFLVAGFIYNPKQKTQAPDFLMSFFFLIFVKVIMTFNPNLNNYDYHPNPCYIFLSDSYCRPAFCNGFCNQYRFFSISH